MTIEDDPSSFDTELAIIEEKIGPIPRTRRWTNLLSDHIWKPSWSWQEPLTPSLKQLLNDQREMFRRGTLVWGGLVKANRYLYERNGMTCPGVAVFALGASLRQTMEVARAVEELRWLDDDEIPDSLKNFAPIVDDDYHLPLMTNVPAELGEGTAFRMCMTFFCQRQLPTLYLTERAFPLLVDPERTDSTLVLPCRYWSGGLTEAWMRRDRELVQLGGPNATPGIFE